MNMVGGRMRGLMAMGEPHPGNFRDNRSRLINGNVGGGGGGHDGNHKKCLLCSTDQNYGQLDDSDLVSDWWDGGDSPGENQLQHVFVLHKLFQIPLRSCREYLSEAINLMEESEELEEEGGSSRLIGFCPPCALLVRNGCKLIEELEEKQLKLSKIRASIFHKLTVTERKNGGSGNNARRLFTLRDNLAEEIKDYLFPLPPTSVRFSSAPTAQQSFRNRGYPVKMKQQFVSSRNIPPPPPLRKMQSVHTPRLFAMTTATAPQTNGIDLDQGQSSLEEDGFEVSYEEDIEDGDLLGEDHHSELLEEGEAEEEDFYNDYDYDHEESDCYGSATPMQLVSAEMAVEAEEGEEIHEGHENGDDGELEYPEASFNNSLDDPHVSTSVDNQDDATDTNILDETEHADILNLPTSSSVAKRRRVRGRGGRRRAVLTTTGGGIGKRVGTSKTKRKRRALPPLPVPRTFRCAYCNDVCDGPMEMYQHVSVSHASVTDWTCSYCPKTYPTYRKLFDHRRKVHRQNHYDLQ